MNTNKVKLMLGAFASLLMIPMLSISPSLAATNAKTPDLNVDLLNIQKETQAYNRNTAKTPLSITSKDYQKIVDNGNSILKDMLTAVNAYQTDLTTLWPTLPEKETSAYPAKSVLKSYGVGMRDYIESQIADLAMVQSCIPGKTKISTCIQEHYPSVIVKEKAAIASLKIPYQAMSKWATKYHKTKVG